jgi:hypothetical protein
MAGTKRKPGRDPILVDKRSLVIFLLCTSPDSNGVGAGD